MMMMPPHMAGQPQQMMPQMGNPMMGYGMMQMQQMGNNPQATQLAHA